MFVAGVGSRSASRTWRNAAPDHCGGLPGLPQMPGFGGRGSTATQSHKSKFKKRK
jgi:hypothetical protein